MSASPIPAIDVAAASVPTGTDGRPDCTGVLTIATWFHPAQLCRRDQLGTPNGYRPLLGAPEGACARVLRPVLDADEARRIIADHLDDGGAIVTSVGHDGLATIIADHLRIPLPPNARPDTWPRLTQTQDRILLATFIHETGAPALIPWTASALKSGIRIDWWLIG